SPATASSDHRRANQESARGRAPSAARNGRVRAPGAPPLAHGASVSRILTMLPQRATAAAEPCRVHVLSRHRRVTVRRCAQFAGWLLLGALTACSNGGSRDTSPPVTMPGPDDGFWTPLVPS